MSAIVCALLVTIPTTLYWFEPHVHFNAYSHSSAVVLFADCVVIL